LGTVWPGGVVRSETQTTVTKEKRGKLRRTTGTNGSLRPRREKKKNLNHVGVRVREGKEL